MNSLQQYILGACLALLDPTSHALNSANNVGDSATHKNTAALSPVAPSVATQDTPVVSALHLFALVRIAVALTMFFIEVAPLTDLKRRLPLSNSNTT